MTNEEGRMSKQELRSPFLFPFRHSAFDIRHSGRPKLVLTESTLITYRPALPVFSAKFPARRVRSGSWSTRPASRCKPPRFLVFPRNA